jgi:hypothetical protein
MPFQEWESPLPRVLRHLHTPLPNLRTALPAQNSPSLSFRQEQEHEKGVTPRHTAARERKLMKPSPRDLDTGERQKEVWNNNLVSSSRP